ncbi:MAG: hypothetical protein KJ025_08130 [Burkholderiales bacterium]|nr:hypothetical protein [Burkholderiales bacterium]
MSDQSPPPDPLELLRRMWTPMSLPIPGMVVPLANAADVEKRIADLRSVEHWLTLNLNVVKMSIQGLEMQHATLAALQSVQQSLGGHAGTHAAAPAGGSAPPAAERGPDAAGAADPANPFEAWWSLLQPSPAEPPGAQSSSHSESGARTRRDPARRQNGGGKKAR